MVLGLDGVFYLINNQRSETMDNNKLTEHELTKRLDGEFSDVDFAYHESPTKGVVATITFYEDKLKDEE
ncbi:hypothetical protein Jormungand_gp47 [Pelagibacter phage Jormungand EXVC012P]|nr:hypothetical protein Jormungand_gp47 [Pelagibacter phage Jormungand EXVC012P]QLF88543.1 hypothetical protein Ran_gp38 [Pelagibacter phage Ran EXVC014P]